MLGNIAMRFCEAVLDRDPAIAVKIMGGLGNQLFQYASARALADRLNAELILDCSDARERSVELDRYHIRATIIDSTSLIRKTYLRLPGKFGRKLSKAVQGLLPPFIKINNQMFQLFKEQRWFQYDERIERISGSVYLIGFWQSFRYFEELLEPIREDLRLKAPLDANNDKWQRRIKETNSICVHVRRGDYVLRAQTFGLCNISYYQDAMEFLRAHNSDARFFLFSDDLAWCRQNFAADDLIFVNSNSPETAVYDLELMRSCRHHIIANSSLSWWAASLATWPGQIVIAPKPWFISEPSDNDLIFKHWMRLPQS
jgi:hypothetical protein